MLLDAMRYGRAKTRNKGTGNLAASLQLTLLPVGNMSNLPPPPPPQPPVLRDRDIKRPASEADDKP